MKKIFKLSIFIFFVFIGLFNSSFISYASPTLVGYKDEIPLYYVSDIYGRYNGYDWTFSVVPSSYSDRVYCLKMVYPGMSYSGNTFVFFSYTNSFTIRLMRNGSTHSGTSANSSYIYRKDGIQFNVTNQVIVNSSSYNVDFPTINGSSQQEIYDALLTGDLGNCTLGNMPLEPSALGFIKPSYSCYGSQLNKYGGSFYTETVTWLGLSTTGFDLTQSGVQVEFAIRDKSFYQKGDFFGNTFFDWNKDRIDFLASRVFPYGSSTRAYLQGQALKSGNYGKMISAGATSGSTRRFTLSPWAMYSKASNTDMVTRSFAQSLTNYSEENKSFLQAIYEVGTNNNVMLTWDIYARIKTNDTTGNWLLINKHSVPVDQQADNLNGMVTTDYIKSNNDPVNDWGDAPDDEPIDDPEGDGDKSIPVGIDNPDDGSPTYVYNNYTYNYDNRSWIENHFDNNDVAEVNEGIEWLKLISVFFGWFNTLFGAFLPSWAVAVVSLGSPIVVGLIIFRVIKGVIPFV